MKIAEMDHLNGQILQLRTTNPDQLDAGYIKTEPDAVVVFQNSEMLELPVGGHELEARAITMQSFEQQTPGRSVRETMF